MSNRPRRDIYCMPYALVGTARLITLCTPSISAICAPGNQRRFIIRYSSTELIRLVRLRLVNQQTRFDVVCVIHNARAENAKYFVNQLLRVRAKLC